MSTKQLIRKVSFFFIFCSFLGMLYSQSTPPIEILDEDDIYKDPNLSPDYIKLQAGTIIGRDTSLITPIINNKKMSYTKFEKMVLFMTTADSLNFSIDSIVVKKLDSEQRIFIFCSQKKGEKSGKSP